MEAFLKMILVVALLHTSLGYNFGTTFATNSIFLSGQSTMILHSEQIQDINSSEFIVYEAKLINNRQNILMRSYKVVNKVITNTLVQNLSTTTYFTNSSIIQFSLHVLPSYLEIIFKDNSNNRCSVYLNKTSMTSLGEYCGIRQIGVIYSKKIGIGIFKDSSNMVYYYNNINGSSSYNVNPTLLLQEPTPIIMIFAAGESRLITLYQGQSYLKIRKVINASQINSTFSTEYSTVSLPSNGIKCYCLNSNETILYILDINGNFLQINILNETLLNIRTFSIGSPKTCIYYKNASTSAQMISFIRFDPTATILMDYEIYNLSSPQNPLSIGNNLTILKNPKIVYLTSNSNRQFVQLNLPYCNSVSTYLDPGTSSCKFCGVTQCMICSNSTNCLECFPRLVFSNSTLKCQNCGSNCLKCINSTNCLQCLPSWLLNNGICICPNGTFVNNSVSACQNCGSNCLSCTNSTNCLQCLPSWLLNGGICSICPNGTFANNSASACQNCSLNCLSCLSQTICQICQSGFTFNNASFVCQIVKPSFSEVMMPVNLDELLQNTFNNSYAQSFNSVPSSRQIFAPLFYFFGNFDDLWLYQFHERNYGNSMSKFFASINILESQKWKLIDNGKMEKIQSFLGINYTQLINRMDRKQKYSGEKFVSSKGHGESLLPNCFFYLTFNFIFVIIMFIFMKLLFTLLYNYRISKLIRPYSFWGYIGVIMIDGNMQIMFFLMFSFSKTLFSFDFEDKMLNLAAINILFLFFIVSVASFFVYLETYKKLAKYFLDNSQCSASGVMSIVICSTLRQLLLSAIHNYLRYDHQKQLLLLALVQILHIAALLYFNNYQKCYEKLNGVWISIFFAFLRVILNVCLYFQQENQNNPELIEIFELIVQYFIFTSMVLYFMGFVWNYSIVIIDGISKILNYCVNLSQQNDEKQNQEEQKKQEKDQQKDKKKHQKKDHKKDHKNDKKQLKSTKNDQKIIKKQQQIKEKIMNLKQYLTLQKLRWEKKQTNIQKINNKSQQKNNKTLKPNKIVKTQFHQQVPPIVFNCNFVQSFQQNKSQKRKPARTPPIVFNWNFVQSMQQKQQKPKPNTTFKTRYQRNLQQKSKNLFIVKTDGYSMQDEIQYDDQIQL